MRPDGRRENELRLLKITPHFTKYAEGSVLIELGETKVICTASIEKSVPSFLKDTGRGWVTAEYSMLPRSTQTRSAREVIRGKPSGRTHEIQRLIGRALRTVVDMKKLGERTIWMDCDVIQADGGTRTAAITGSFVALYYALSYLKETKNILPPLISDYLAAVSVGIVKGEPLLDLSYIEDSTAEVDMNIIMTGSGKFIEIQGTAERKPFDWDDLQGLLGLARAGINQLIKEQRKLLENTFCAKLL